MKTVSLLPRNKAKCIRKFLYYFPGGFDGKKYIAWERDYKWNAHLSWKENLNKKEYEKLMSENNYTEIARRASWLESKTNLLFSFEKMALRDGVKTPESAKLFSEGLFQLVYSKKKLQQRFEFFSNVIAELPRKQTRVLTWPLQTVFGFISDPTQHIFLKPKVTQEAARKYGFSFIYTSKPNWETYQSLLDFAEVLNQDLAHLAPKDMIDIQSFIWVMGSEEYPD